MAERSGSYPIDAKEAAERIAAARDRNPGVPEHFRSVNGETPASAWLAGWRAGLGEARVVIADLATGTGRYAQ